MSFHHSKYPLGAVIHTELGAQCVVVKSLVRTLVIVDVKTKRMQEAVPLMVPTKAPKELAVSHTT
jgi:serine acetyltransferase